MRYGGMRQWYPTNTMCFGNTKHWVFRQGYRSNDYSKKKSHLYFHTCIKWCSLNTNEDLFADWDCSIIYVEQKSIITNLGTDAARAKLCIFIIRLTKYQFTHKLTLHNRMCSHSLAGVMLKFIICSNTKWVSYSHRRSIYCLSCSISSIFL